MQIGGPLGAYFPPSYFDVPFDYEAYTAKGGLIGHAGLVVFDDTADMLKQARFAMEFCSIESCGKCTPCRIGAVRGTETLDKLAAGIEPDKQIAVVTDSLQHDEVRIALRSRRVHPLPGDERAHPFPPRRFQAAYSRRKQRNRRNHHGSPFRKSTFGTPASQVSKNKSR